MKEPGINSLPCYTCLLCFFDNCWEGKVYRVICWIFLEFFAVSPKVTLAKKFFVARGQTASLICQVEGNPKPTISWDRCDQPTLLCDKQYLNVSNVQTERTNYSCTASNYLGSDSATTVLRKWYYNELPMQVTFAIVHEIQLY